MNFPFLYDIFFISISARSQWASEVTLNDAAHLPNDLLIDMI